MNAFCPLVALCCFALSGCVSREHQHTAQTPEKELPQKGQACMLEVKNFALTEENLRLDYRVDNLFPHDIWVCEDVAGYPFDDRQDAETRIIDETLWINIHNDLESNSASRVYARYRRLPQGQSRSRMILLDLRVFSRRSGKVLVYIRRLLL